MIVDQMNHSYIITSDDELGERINYYDFLYFHVMNKNSVKGNKRKDGDYSELWLKNRYKSEDEFLENIISEIESFPKDIAKTESSKMIKFCAEYNVKEWRTSG